MSFQCFATLTSVWRCDLHFVRIQISYMQIYIWPKLAQVYCEDERRWDIRIVFIPRDCIPRLVQTERGPAVGCTAAATHRSGCWRTSPHGWMRSYGDGTRTLTRATLFNERTDTLTMGSDIWPTRFRSNIFCIFLNKSRSCKKFTFLFIEQKSY